MRLRSVFFQRDVAAQPSRKLSSGESNTEGQRPKLTLRKRILFIFVANFLSIGLLAIVGEIGLRIAAPQLEYGTLPDWMLDTLQFSDDIYLGWELRPGGFGHNSYGIRGPETTREKPEGVWRIAMIGDSVTYGLGVEDAEAFPARVESKLRDADIGPVEVLNFGVPGYNTFQEYTQLKTRGLDFQPDLVVMTFTPDDVETTPVIINVGGSMCLFRNHFEGVGLLNNSVHWAIFRVSHLYRFLYKTVSLAIAAPEIGYEVGNLRPEVEWQNVMRTADLCAEHDTEFLLVFSPWLLPYCPPPEEEPYLPDLEGFHRYEEAFDKVRELARKNGVDTLDLGPLYQEYSGQLKLKPIDLEHLNPLGCELVAGKLSEKLLKLRAQQSD